MNGNQKYWYSSSKHLVSTIISSYVLLWAYVKAWSQTGSWCNQTCFWTRPSNHHGSIVKPCQQTFLKGSVYKVEVTASSSSRPQSGGVFLTTLGTFSREFAKVESAAGVCFWGNYRKLAAALPSLSISLKCFWSQVLLPFSVCWIQTQKSAIRH